MPEQCRSHRTDALFRTSWASESHQFADRYQGAGASSRFSRDAVTTATDLLAALGRFSMVTCRCGRWTDPTSIRRRGWVVPPNHRAASSTRDTPDACPMSLSMNSGNRLPFLQAMTWFAPVFTAHSRPVGVSHCAHRHEAADTKSPRASGSSRSDVRAGLDSTYTATSPRECLDA
jgi:hypothetical protein